MYTRTAYTILDTIYIWLVWGRFEDLKDSFFVCVYVYIHCHSMYNHVHNYVYVLMDVVCICIGYKLLSNQIMRVLNC